MVEFVCNICDTRNSWRGEHREGDLCNGCNSTMRMRSILLTLSRTLFGSELRLSEFPILRSLRGLGISDDAGYAREFEKLFSYVNTYYHREPRLDLVNPVRNSLGEFDFIVCSDVLEHVLPPTSNAFSTLSTLLKPSGFLLLTVPYGLDDGTIEHFKDLSDFSFVQVAGKTILVGVGKNGKYEIREDLVFHGGPGATAEMRIFSLPDLIGELSAVDLIEVRVDGVGSDTFGVRYGSQFSLPLVASRVPVTLPAATMREMVEEYSRVRRTIGAIRDSRWFKLGRRLGLGPTLDRP